MKTYSTRSNAKAGIIVFRKAHPDMTDVGINVVPDGGQSYLCERHTSTFHAANDSRHEKQQNYS